MSQGSEWREVVLGGGSGSGRWPSAHSTPQALLFKLILNLIKNKPAEAGGSAGLVALQLEDIGSHRPPCSNRRKGESPPIITFTCKKQGTSPQEPWQQQSWGSVRDWTEPGEATGSGGAQCLGKSDVLAVSIGEAACLLCISYPFSLDIMGQEVLYQLSFNYL